MTKQTLIPPNPLLFPKRALILEDDKYYAYSLEKILNPLYQVDITTNLTTALQRVVHQRYDLIITDLHLNLDHAIDFLQAIYHLSAQKIVLTSSQDEQEIKEAYLLGAQHVLSKQNVGEDLTKVLSYLESIALNQSLDATFPTQDTHLRQKIHQLLTKPWYDRALLLTGPTGTGKSTLGKFLADYLTQGKGPFIHLNCAEIPDSLIESELFGHEKGSFTGALQAKAGKLKLADKGFLFLDEVGSMSLAMQAKLLKAIEDKTFFPVGATNPQHSSFQLISATCENLNSKLQKKEFREDLYFRISGLHLDIPPLKNRPQDILQLLDNFQKKSVKKILFEDEALQRITHLPFPGNIRELKQLYYHLLDLNKGIISASDIPLNTSKISPHEKLIATKDFSQYEHIRSVGLRNYIRELEKNLALDALKRHNGKITYCIKELKISSSSFYRILHEHQISLSTLT
jgi:DNA-binding NtrC family response regulator